YIPGCHGRTLALPIALGMAKLQLIRASHGLEHYMGLRLGASSSQQAFEARADEELSHLITEFTNEINWHMRQHGLTRAKLAKRMGVSPGRVSQILSGGENLTLRTLASLTTALDARCEVMLRSSDADVKGNE